MSCLFLYSSAILGVVEAACRISPPLLLSPSTTHEVNMRYATDIQTLKDSIDLSAMIASDLGQPTVKGKRLWWPCPFHAEKTPGNAFCLTPNGDGYKCFSCGASGDHITWLQQYRGITEWREVFAELERLAGSVGASIQSPTHHPKPRPKPPAGPPPAEWQRSAENFITRSEECLWSEKGSDALAYLLDQRCLNEETIKHYRLGFNPRDTYDQRKSGDWTPRTRSTCHAGL